MSLPDEPILVLNGVTKIYPNQVIANDDIYLNIQGGHVHVLVGENGAGKTTLMKYTLWLDQAYFRRNNI